MFLRFPSASRGCHARFPTRPPHGRLPVDPTRPLGPMSGRFKDDASWALQLKEMPRTRRRTNMGTLPQSQLRVHRKSQTSFRPAERRQV